MRTIPHPRRRDVIACVAAWAGARAIAAPEPRGLDEPGPIGWASVDGGTTGGRDGPSVTVRDPAAFAAAVAGDTPVTVVVAGPIVLDRTVRVASNTSIVGADRGAVLSGAGLHIGRAHNVIVRNLSIHGSRDDAISVQDGSHHVWIDHCDLARANDGLIDIKRASDLVTVSWCRFHDHHKTSLVGHSDAPDVLAADRGRLRVTYHHNFFDRSRTRHPRVRIAETVHVFNNYFRGNEYGVASVSDAGVLVESNCFEDVRSPTHTMYGDSKLPGRLVARDNALVRSGAIDTAGEVAEVPYRYTLDAADAVAGIVRAGAGPR
jgi:pectate lyase